MRFIIILTLLISTYLSASTNNNYKLSPDINKSKEYFFSHDFDEIIRFDAIMFADNNLSTSGLKTLKEMTQQISSLKEGKRNFFISVLGHARKTTDNKNENRIDSDIYANKIQNNFRDTFDTNQSLDRSESYAQRVVKHLVEEGVDKNLIELEYRGSYDSLYSQRTKENKSLSSRVMISLYIEENLDLDDDGVVNSRDFCPYTKEGIVVDDKGCKFKSIILLAEHTKGSNAIEITTKHSSTVIDTPKDYTLLKSEDDAPRLYKSMPDEKMNAIFSDVEKSSKMTKFILYFNSRDVVNEDEDFSKVIEYLSINKDAYIQIIGHTDTKGTAVYNEELAHERAEIVAQKIRDSGAKYLHIQVESYGEYNLAVKTANGVGEALNRRVEVLIR